MLAAVPLVFPSYVSAFTLVAALGPRGYLAGWLAPLGVERLPGFAVGYGGALLSLALFTYPYIFLLLVAAFFAGPRAEAQARKGKSNDKSNDKKVYKITLETMATEGTPWHKMYQRFIKKVTKASNGRLKIKAKFGSPLGENVIAKRCIDGKVDACGVTEPKNVKLDGRSVLPALEHPNADWPDRILFLQFHRGDRPQRLNNCAVITQRWKLVSPGSATRAELYDMAADPHEQKDLAQARPEVVKRLLVQYDAWLKSLAATRPGRDAAGRFRLNAGLAARLAVLFLRMPGEVALPAPDTRNA